MDDIYPNEGSYYQPEAPAETLKGNKEELKKTEEAMPFIDGVLSWFDKTAADTDSIALAVRLADSYGKSVEETVIALDIARMYLEQKKGELKSLANTFRE